MVFIIGLFNNQQSFFSLFLFFCSSFVKSLHILLYRKKGCVRFYNSNQNVPSCCRRLERSDWARCVLRCACVGFLSHCAISHAHIRLPVSTYLYNHGRKSFLKLFFS